MKLTVYPLFILSLLLLAGCGNTTSTDTATDTAAPSTVNTPEPPAATDGTSSDSSAAADSGASATSPSGTSTAADSANSGGAASDSTDPAAPSLESFGERIREAANAGDFAGALTITDEAILAFPESIDMQLNRLMLSIGASQRSEASDPEAAAEGHLKSGEYARALLPKADQLPGQIRGVFPLALYNSARGYAHQGKVGESLAAFKEAVEMGASGLNDLDQDPLLANVRDNAEFKAGIATIQAELQEKIIETCRQEIAESESFPFDVNLPDLDGNDIKLSDYKGKIVIVDVWGTWCPPCQKEIPHFVRLLEEHKDDLAIIGINYEHGDPADAVAKIKSFAKDNGINYPCVIGDESTQNQIPNLEGFPTTLFLDRTGKVRLKLVGYHPFEQLQIYYNLLTESPALPN